MCNRSSAIDQQLKVGLPSHRAPQHVLEASVRHLPSVDHSHHYALFEPMQVLPGGQGCTQAWLTLMRMRP